LPELEQILSMVFWLSAAGLVIIWVAEIVCDILRLNSTAKKIKDD